MKPFSVSVVIPTYNRGGLVVAAIKSILEQTEAPDEIIVIDDGSTDDTESRLKEFGDAIRYQKTTNKGVSSARNLGWQLAHSRWIAFLDSDDIWTPDKLQKQKRALQKHPDCQLCFAGSEDEKQLRLDDLLKMHPELTNSAEGRFDKNQANFFLHPAHPYLQSLLVTKEALSSAGGFDESLRVAEDTKLLYRLVIDNPYAVVPEALVTIQRERAEAGLSDQMDADTAAIRFRCYARVQSEFYWELLESNPRAAKKLRVNLAYFLSRWAEIASVRKNYPLARTLGREAFTLTSCGKEKLRSLLAVIAPQVLAKRYRTKWIA